MAKNLSCFILLISILGIHACSKKSKELLDVAYLKPIAGTEKILISSVDHTSFIQLEYTKENELSSEYIASFIAMTYYDSVGENIEENKIERIKINLGFPEYIDTFLYNVSLMKEYKKGLEASAKFIANMIAGKSENSLPLVDESKIKREDLERVNGVGQEIKDGFGVKKISYDGFILIPNESNKMQTKVRFTNATEEMHVTFQYDINRGKIFYFGVND